MRVRETGRLERHLPTACSVLDNRDIEQAVMVWIAIRIFYGRLCVSFTWARRVLVTSILRGGYGLVPVRVVRFPSLA